MSVKPESSVNSGHILRKIEMLRTLIINPFFLFHLTHLRLSTSRHGFFYTNIEIPFIIIRQGENSISINAKQTGLCV